MLTFSPKPQARTSWWAMTQRRWAIQDPRATTPPPPWKRKHPPEHLMSSFPRTNSNYPHNSFPPDKPVRPPHGLTDTSETTIEDESSKGSNSRSFLIPVSKLPKIRGPGQYDAHFGPKFFSVPSGFITISTWDDKFCCCRQRAEKIHADEADFWAPERDIRSSYVAAVGVAAPGPAPHVLCPEVYPSQVPDPPAVPNLNLRSCYTRDFAYVFCFTHEGQN